MSIKDSADLGSERIEELTISVKVVQKGFKIVRNKIEQRLSSVS